MTHPKQNQTYNHLHHKIIVACDVASKGELDLLLANLPSKIYLKLGLQFFYHEGFYVLNELHKRKYHVMVDVKIFDIPTTMKNALLSLSNFPFSAVTVHLTGEIEKLVTMLPKSIVKKIAGVTVLTSYDEKSFTNSYHSSLSIKMASKEMVKRASNCGITKIICPPTEVKNLKSCYPQMDYFCPGIRATSHHHDQLQVQTPIEAITNGASYIIVGREITKNNNPKKMYQQIAKQIQLIKYN